MHKNNFDFLRFLFAFVVVLFHIVVLSNHSDLQFLKPWFDFYLSVTGFFVISGFLVTASLINSPNIKAYLIKRSRRLLPAYITVIVLCALLFSIAGTLSAKEYFGNGNLYSYMGANLLFLNFLQPCLPGLFLQNLICTVNGALWTIKVEVCFYLILPVLILLLQHIRKKYILFAVIYVIAVLYQYLFGYLTHRIPEHAILMNNLKHQLPGFMAYFISGIAFYYYFDHFKKRKHLWALLALPVFITEYYFNLEILLPLALSVLILYFAYGFTFLNNFGRNGDFSYGIYIYHYPLIQLIVSLGWFQKFNPWLVSCIVVLMVLILGVLSWNLLENRFLKRKLVQKLKPDNGF
jgi:peptidoglycan/LPS O-acetylase OafA/YrhL